MTTPCRVNPPLGGLGPGTRAGALDSDSDSGGLRLLRP